MKNVLLVAAALLFAVSAQAQHQFFSIRVENVSQTYSFLSSGIFDTPEAASAPGPIGPGGAYVFAFDAAPGARLSFATMFVPSNDVFIAPSQEGIPLWNADGTQAGGDLSGQLMLWDAGTEANQEPGVGADQAQRQAGANVGAADPDATVRQVADGFTYPPVEQVAQFTLTPMGGTRFEARIENVSMVGTLMPTDGSMQAVPMAPGVWVVHAEDSPLFANGSVDRGMGLEALAEDGGAGTLGGNIAAQTGVNQILSPGIWAIHDEAAPLFEAGTVDRGQGMEHIAEDGNPAPLASALSTEVTTTVGAFAIPDGAAGPGPITAGGAYEFTVVASMGARLSLATMLVQSNDLFYSPDEGGIALWDAGGLPVAGDVTDQLALWDAGTEVNERPGFGLNQAPRQAGANTGMPENGDVRLVNDGFAYPVESDVIRLTITPLETTPFTVTIENVSASGTLMPSDGSMQAVPMAPGVWVVHAGSGPLFSAGVDDRGLGLEAIAEDGNPAPMSSALSAKLGHLSGVFNTPVGSGGPAPIGPGDRYSFSFEAAPGASISFATMFVPSNDLFFAPEEPGIALWNTDGMPVTGDVTDLVYLWDAGTELNQEPGVGPDQAQRQSAPDTGASDSDASVRIVVDAFAYPAVADVIRVSIAATSTAVDDEIGVPESFTLSQNYPNPFNPETTISFALQQAGHVRLAVFDILGRQVADLLDAARPAGTHEIRWGGASSGGDRVATGVYLYRLDVDGASAVRTMVLLR